MSKQTFDFSEALRRMRQGKKVTRKAATSIEYVTLVENLFYAKRYMHDNLILTMFCSKDILATDWEEVKDERTR